MKLIFDKPLGNGNPYAPSQKCIWSALIGAGASLLGNMLGSEQQAGYTKEQQKLQSKLNRQEMQHSMALQENYQNMLWNKGAAKSVSGMKHAGLNPAMAGGTSLGGASGSGGVAKPSSGASGPSASSGSPLGSQAVSAAMDVQRAQNETDVAQSQVKLNESAAALNNKKAGLTQKDIDTYDEKWDQAKRESESRIKGNNARAYSDWQQGKLYGQQAKTEEERTENERLHRTEIKENIEIQRQQFRNLLEENTNHKFNRLKAMQELRLAWKHYKLDVSGFNFHQRTTIKRLEYEYKDVWSRYITAETTAEMNHWKGQIAKIQATLDSMYGLDERQQQIFLRWIGAGGSVVRDYGIGLSGAGRFRFD